MARAPKNRAFMMGVLHRERGESSRREQQSKRSRPRITLEVDANLCKAAACMKQRRLTLAMHAAEHALRLRPDNQSAEVMLELARARRFARDGDDHSALSAYERAVVLDRAGLIPAEEVELARQRVASRGPLSRLLDRFRGRLRMATGT